MNSMLYIGTLAKEPDRDSFWIQSFRNFGWNVHTLSTNRIIDNKMISRFNKRFNVGSFNTHIQNELLSLIQKKNPIWVHFRLPIEFDSVTIKLIKNKGIIITEYCNDDPFSPKAPFGLYWKFKRAIPFYDAHFVFRERNIQEFYNANALNVIHCPPFYDPNLHFFENKTKKNEIYLYDAAFIGHWENDWRLECLNQLNDHGFNVIIKGGGWDKVISDRKLKHLLPITHAFGKEYNEIYKNSISGLCFFSKINRDKLTRRAFEIIAVGGLLVAERTSEVEKYFIDRKEAYFFSTIDELINIVTELKNNPLKRSAVQEAGYKRLLESKNSITDRALLIHNFVKNKIS
jgi:spore maturation protein CgeB